MAKFLIFKKNGEEIGEKVDSYESAFKDDTTTNRPHDKAEPKAIHIELPEGMDEDCAVATWMEIQPEQVITLREATEDEGAIVQTIPAIIGWGLVEDSAKILAKRQTKADANLETVRQLRESLLTDADHSINTIEDAGGSALALRQYRKALRECTDSYKKVDGSAKLICENMVPEEFSFPAKPE